MLALNNHSRNTIDKNHSLQNSSSVVKKKFFIIEDNDEKAIEKRKDKLKKNIEEYENINKIFRYSINQNLIKSQNIALLQQLNLLSKSNTKKGLNDINIEYYYNNTNTNSSNKHSEHIESNGNGDILIKKLNNRNHINNLTSVDKQIRDRDFRINDTTQQSTKLQLSYQDNMPKQNLPNSINANININLKSDNQHNPIGMTVKKNKTDLFLTDILNNADRNTSQKKIGINKKNEVKIPKTEKLNAEVKQNDEDSDAKKIRRKNYKDEYTLKHRSTVIKNINQATNKFKSEYYDKENSNDISSEDQIFNELPEIELRYNLNRSLNASNNVRENEILNILKAPKIASKRKKIFDKIYKIDDNYLDKIEKTKRLKDKFELSEYQNQLYKVLILRMGKDALKNLSTKFKEVRLMADRVECMDAIDWKEVCNEIDSACGFERARQANILNDAKREAEPAEKTNSKLSNTLKQLNSLKDEIKINIELPIIKNDSVFSSRLCKTSFRKKSSFIKSFQLEGGELVL